MIDVKEEAKIAAEQFIGSGEHIYERRVRLAMWIEEFSGMIRREQMALVLAEITRRRDQYPTDIFGEGTEPDASLDSKSARMARVTCDNLEREIKEAIRECNACEKQSSSAAWAGDVCPMCEENNAKAAQLVGRM